MSVVLNGELHSFSQSKAILASINNHIDTHFKNNRIFSEKEIVRQLKTNLSTKTIQKIRNNTDHKVKINTIFSIFSNIYKIEDKAMLIEKLPEDIKEYVSLSTHITAEDISNCRHLILAENLKGAVELINFDLDKYKFENKLTEDELELFLVNRKYLKKHVFVKIRNNDDFFIHPKDVVYIYTKLFNIQSLAQFYKFTPEQVVAYIHRHCTEIDILNYISYKEARNNEESERLIFGNKAAFYIFHKSQGNGVSFKEIFTKFNKEGYDVLLKMLELKLIHCDTYRKTPPLRKLLQYQEGIIFKWNQINPEINLVNISNRMKIMLDFFSEEKLYEKDGDAIRFLSTKMSPETKAKIIQCYHQYQKQKNEIIENAEFNEPQINKTLSINMAEYIMTLE